MSKSKYTKPKLDGHKVLYAGKRYYVFEVSETHPYDSYEADYEFVIFDKSDELYNGVVAYGNVGTDGIYHCSTPFGVEGYPFSAGTIPDVVKRYREVEDYLQNEYFQ